MNIVDLIKGNLTSELLSKLGTAIGTDAESTRSAANAAVPSLLSVLSGLATNGQGVDKLLAALKGFDAESPNRLRTDIVEGKGARVQEQGADILGSLLGGNLSTLINVLTKFSGVGAGAIKGLLGYLAPLILSVIASQLKSKGSLSATGLTSFFNDQKANISNALPPGLSLAGLPSATPIKVSMRPNDKDTTGIPSWFLPLMVLGLLALALWYFYLQEPVVAPPPAAPVAVDHKVTTPPAEAKEVVPPAEVKVEIPTADEVIKDLGDVHVTAIQALASVKDGPTADAAIPTLTDLDSKIESAKALWDQLAEPAKAAVTKATAENLGSFKTLVGKTLEIPGVAEKLKTILDALVTKLTAFTV